MPELVHSFKDKRNRCRLKNKFSAPVARSLNHNQVYFFSAFASLWFSTAYQNRLYTEEEKAYKFFHQRLPRAWEAHDVYYALKYDWKDLLHQTKSVKHIGKSKEVGTLRYLSLVVPLTKVGDEAVHKELGDRMERAATTASSLEAEQDSDAQTRFEAASKSPMIHLSQELTHLDVGRTYALIEYPTIYVSFIKQFWKTATARTSATREVELTATIDGQEKTIIEAFLRRHLKLEDNGGVNTLPNSEIFEQLALMRKLLPCPHDIPLQSVHSLGRDEGSLSLHELTILCTNLLNKVTSLEAELAQTKQTYGTALTKLIKKVKKLEQTVKTSQSRRRTRVALSDEEEVSEDPSKQGRSLIEELDLDAEISLVPPHDAEIQEKISNDTEVLLEEEETTELIEEPTELVEDQGSSEKGNKRLLLLILHLILLVYQLVLLVQLLRKRIARDAEIAKQLQEEYDKARKKEAIAEVVTAHVIDWNDPSVISYDDIRPIFEKVWDQVHSFVPLDSEEEVQRLKRAGQDVEAKPAKRQRTKEVSEIVQEQIDEEPKTDELSQEQLNQMVIIVPDEGINVEDLQTKYPITGWEVYSEDTMQF
ncbi:hypothetical protein Tco_0681080 [Tanacetum coccineum]|uniref:Uncharacterized protein n=1 Tax=Tanacetum coccineum TaxID=301880 RepID=A0ABQ4XN90_9ASTR